MHGITKHPPSCVILSDTKIGSHLLRLTLLCVSSPLTHSFLCTCEKCVYRATWGVIITSDPLIILPRAARHKTNTNLEASNQTIIRSGTNRPSVFPSVCVRVCVCLQCVVSVLESYCHYHKSPSYPYVWYVQVWMCAFLFVTLSLHQVSASSIAKGAEYNEALLF